VSKEFSPPWMTCKGPGRPLGRGFSLPTASGIVPAGSDPILPLGRRWGRVSERRPAAGSLSHLDYPYKGADHRTMTRNLFPPPLFLAV
jgi:hypothetical protein